MKKILFSIICLIGLIFGISGCKKDEDFKITDTRVLSMGGCTCLMSPIISPLDSNLLLTISDMGGIYVSSNKGESFYKNNLKGRVYAACFDPIDENVIYAGGCGIYKSCDKGNSFDLIFPKEEDIYKTMTKYEYNRYYYYTYDSLYPTYSDVSSIVVNPYNNSEIFALFEFYGLFSIYKSSDSGESFNPILEYNSDSYYNELFYDYNGNLLVVNSGGIYKLINNELEVIYESSSYIVDIDIVFEEKKTYYVVIENNDLVSTRLFYTSDFIDYVYLDEYIKNYEYNWENRGVSFNINLEYVSAYSTNDIYVTISSVGYFMDTLDKYDYDIEGILRIKDKESSYLYGLPSKNSSLLTNKAWIDGVYDMYGISVDKNNPDSFLFTTLCGIYYAYDNFTIKQCYSNVYNNNGVISYNSTGIDSQTTYGIRIDPFDSNHMIVLNTDLGLSYSYDGGNTWNWSYKGVEMYRNTLYDLYFDNNTKGLVYGLWSNRHDATYYASGDELTDVYGCFSVSYDGGITWDSNYSSGLPKNAIPVKMSVVENKDSLTIYVSCFNEGFYVSYDSGKNFISLNDGIDSIDYNGHSYIYGCDIVSDSHSVYAITSMTYYFNSIQKGAIYELVNNKWVEIYVSDDFMSPRSLTLYNGDLYISSICNYKYDWYEDITKYKNICGGVYLYSNGIIFQIFYEDISVSGICFNEFDDMFISDICGNIYYYNGNEYVLIYSEFHMISKGIIYVGSKLYLPTFGGGLLEISYTYK